MRFWEVYFNFLNSIQVVEEKFTSLCYAGHLPGYTMNYNHHGLIFSINTLSAKVLRGGKTREHCHFHFYFLLLKKYCRFDLARHFITRALLSAETFEQAQKILRDTGVGAADGCSINMTFLKWVFFFFERICCRCCTTKTFILQTRRKSFVPQCGDGPMQRGRKSIAAKHTDG